MIQRKNVVRTGLILLIGIGFFFAFRDSITHSQSNYPTQAIELLGGEKIELSTKLKGPRSIPIPFIVHGAISLSDDPWIFTYEFQHRGNVIKWEGRGMWELLNFYEGDYYVWAWDLFSGSGYSKSKLYRYASDSETWHEIDRSDFPKGIAIPNINIKTKRRNCKQCGGYSEMDLMTALDPLADHFSSTSAAHLWLFLETGEHLHQPYWEVDKEILINFKKKYIRQSIPLNAKEHP